jgi:hypothetical protein
MYLHLAQARLMAKDGKGADAALRTAQAAGLDASSLHPLDKKTYDRMLIELTRR